MKAALQNYQARMRRVLDYIDRHLDSDLDLETVSGVAAFSKFHFHRQFTATFGPLDNARSKLMQKTFTTDDVTIRDVPPTPVAIMEHRGDPAIRSAPPSSGSSRGTGPLACRPRQGRPSMSGVPSGVLRRLPLIEWTFVSGPTNPSRRTASRSKPARSLADAARCCAS